MNKSSLFLSLTVATTLLFSGSVRALKFEFDFGAGFTTNQKDGVRAAGKVWEAVIKDDVTVKVDIDWKLDFKSNEVAGTDTKMKYMGYSSLRDLMVNDEKKESNRHGLVEWLPKLGSFTTDNQLQSNPVIWASQANWKALGLTGNDFFASNNNCDQFNRCWDGSSDAEVFFNPQYFDGETSNDRSMDDVALHELGHVLGFNSIIDYGERAKDGPTTLDMYRTRDEEYKAGGVGGTGSPGGMDPITFTNMKRNLTPSPQAGTAYPHPALVLDYYDDPPYNARDMIVSSGFDHQAGHWADREPPLEIGAMDPGWGAYHQYPMPFISKYDLYAMDLIGWDVDTQYLDPMLEWNAGLGDLSSSFLEILKGFHNHDTNAYVRTINKVALLAPNDPCGNTILDCGQALDTAYELAPLELMNAFQTDLNEINVSLGDLAKPLLVAPWAGSVSGPMPSGPPPEPSPVPEPGAPFLIGLGLLSLLSRRKTKATG